MRSAINETSTQLKAERSGADKRAPGASGWQETFIRLCVRILYWRRLTADEVEFVEFRSNYSTYQGNMYEGLEEGFSRRLARQDSGGWYI